MLSKDKCWTSFTLLKTDLAKLKEIAAKEERSVASILRLLIKQYLTNQTH